MNRYRKLIIILSLILLPIPSVFPQVQVDLSKNLIDVVKSLEGPGVKISNISFSIPPASPTSPIAYFEDLNNYTGIDKGVLLTSGGAILAEGPNYSDLDYKTQINSNYIMTDPDLGKYADSLGLSLRDISYIEFDIVTSSSVLSFEYVFASEEYPNPDFIVNYNDIFALLISGPGISGKRNLAVIPNTNIPVSVSNINHTKNIQYYRSNTGYNPFIQYNGMTVVFTASAEVIPCQTYRIKLVIADAGDALLDSGVFIKQGSFKSEEPPVMSVYYEHPEFDYAIEECNNAIVKFERPSTMSDTIDLVYKIQLAGTAINGTDYKEVNDSIVIPAGEQAGYLMIEPLADNMKEGEEIIRIVIGSSCPQFPDIATYEFPLRDVFPYSVPSEAICFKESVQLNKDPEPGTSMRWESNSNLDCSNCLSPVLTPDDTEYISYTITHNTSGCKAVDSLLVEVTKIIPDFSFYSDECYTLADVTFVNNSSDATNYVWNFGDGETSQEPNPIHTYPANNTKSSIQYFVTLTASTTSPACMETFTRTVTIKDPLFIPNLITADNNGKNEEFRISGFGGQCWTLYLYNRWGGLVYKQENYTDQFNGSGIESGNYYYVIENGKKDRSFSGWLHIIKNIE